MTKGKGIGPAPILAITTISTVFILVLDHYGVTTAVQRFIQRIVDNG